MLQDAAHVWRAPSHHLTTQSNDVARFCVEMLRAFGQAFTREFEQIKSSTLAEP